MINCHWKRKHLKNLRILILFFRGKDSIICCFFLGIGCFPCWLDGDWLAACERTGKEKGEWLGQQFGVWTLPTQVKSCLNRQILLGMVKNSIPKKLQDDFSWKPSNFMMLGFSQVWRSTQIFAPVNFSGLHGWNATIGRLQWMIIWSCFCRELEPLAACYLKLERQSWDIPMTRRTWCFKKFSWEGRFWWFLGCLDFS